jgi:hypothetical protein
VAVQATKVYSIENIVLKTYGLEADQQRDIKLTKDKKLNAFIQRADQDTLTGNGDGVTTVDELRRYASSGAHIAEDTVYYTIYQNKIIPQINKEAKKLAESQGVTYVEIYADKNDMMKNYLFENIAYLAMANATVSLDGALSVKDKAEYQKLLNLVKGSKIGEVSGQTADLKKLLRKYIPEILNKLTPELKIQYAMQLMLDSRFIGLSYNDTTKPIVNGKSAAYTVADIFAAPRDQRIGDCSEFSNMLDFFLQKLGIPCQLVQESFLKETRNTQDPQISMHLIVQAEINNKVYYLDPSTVYTQTMEKTHTLPTWAEIISEKITNYSQKADYWQRPVDYIGAIGLYYTEVLANAHKDTISPVEFSMDVPIANKRFADTQNIFDTFEFSMLLDPLNYDPLLNGIGYHLAQESNKWVGVRPYKISTEFSQIMSDFNINIYSKEYWLNNMLEGPYRYLDMDYFNSFTQAENDTMYIDKVRNIFAGLKKYNLPGYSINFFIN